MKWGCAILHFMAAESIQYFIEKIGDFFSALSSEVEFYFISYDFFLF